MQINPFLKNIFTSTNQSTNQSTNKVPMKNKYGDNAIRTTVFYKDKEYLVYKDSNSNYYYLDNKGYKQYLIGNTEFKNNLKSNIPASFTINNSNLGINTNQKSTSTSTSTDKTQQQTQENTNNTGNYYDGYAAGLAAGYSNYMEPEKPKVYSAKEVADLLNLDYRTETQTLEDFNKASNEYYDSMVSNQDKIRGEYAYNNARYLEDSINNYLQSYTNTAPTATGKAANAANALSAQLAGGYTNNINDTGLLQSINTLNEQREAEIANNKTRAKNYYDDLNLALANIGTNYNTAETASYTNSVQALATKYAADRSYAGYLATAAAARYKGLTDAYNTNVDVNNWSALYNQYKAAGLTDQQAAQRVSAYYSVNSGTSAYNNTIK